MDYLHGIRLISVEPLKVQVKKHKKKRINKKYISRYGYKFIDKLGDKIMHDTINNVLYCSSVMYQLIKQEIRGNDYGDG
ncbi:hypothetical protein M0P65_07305 [Candidatus Gracilibacteria bacterium]|jgi:hypothetical protein|nr:hypothetical protein [Candidatus Gracilibacteria bacterium]